MAVKIFISHHTQDAELASALVRLLRSALELTSSEIRFTSDPAYGITPGAPFATVLSDDLKSAAVVIGVLSQASIKRSWVLFELGHAWAGDKGIALLASDVGPGQIPGPLAQQQAVHAGNGGNILGFLDHIQQRCDLGPIRSSLAQPAVSEFLARVAELDQRLANGRSWADAQILTDRRALFESGIDVLKTHGGLIQSVEIYAPTGVWEFTYREKKRWFQALAQCLSNYAPGPIDWSRGEVIDRDILAIRTRLHSLSGIFGMPHKRINGYAERIENVGQALGYFHGLRDAHLLEAPVDSSTIPGIGFIRIDQTVIAAWAVGGDYGVDTAIAISDHAIGDAVRSWFGNARGDRLGNARRDKFKARPLVIQDLRHDRDYCVTKGMNRIRKKAGLPLAPDCPQHGPDKY